MARDQRRIEERNSKIGNRFKALIEKEYNGKSLYRYEVILEMLADEFYLSPSTIHDIIKCKQ